MWRFNQQTTEILQSTGVYWVHKQLSMKMLHKSNTNTNAIKQISKSITTIGSVFFVKDGHNCLKTKTTHQSTLSK